VSASFRSTPARLTALCLVLALAAILRARSLDTHGLWLDEFGTLWASLGDTAVDAARRAWHVHGQTPLYYLLVRAWSSVFGESELALRVPSFLAGAVVPLLGYLTLARAGGRRAGVAALVLLGANPLLVFVSHQARPYALAALGVGLAHWGLGRALRSGSGRDRLIAWFGAVLAAYCTPLCAPVVGCLLIGVFATGSEQRRYTGRAALVDACIALGALVPMLLQFASVVGRRGSLQTWLPEADLGLFVRMLPGLAAVLVLGAVIVVARGLDGRRRLKAPAGVVRGLVAFEVAGVVLVAGGLLLGLGVGINLLVARYVLLFTLAGCLLLARVIGVLPWPMAGIALSCVLLAPQAQHTRGERAWPQWREAVAELDRNSPLDEPLVVRTGFVEAEGLLVPPFVLDPRREAFLSAPVLTRPSAPSGTRRVLQLPFHWGISSHQGDYFERRFVPTLARRKSFAVIAPPDVVDRFGQWVQWRFDGRFTRVSAAGPFRTSGRVSVLVARYQAQ
jgi:hypothetical protein